jgi:hypothetical protein
VHSIPHEHRGADLRLIDTADRAELERRFPELATPLPRPGDGGWCWAPVPVDDPAPTLPGLEPTPAELAGTYARQAAELEAMVRAEDARQRTYARVILDALAELRGALDQLAGDGAAAEVTR